MILWLILTAMTLAVLVLLLLPLMRRSVAAPQRVAYDLVVYRDQLAEVDKDVERGLLPPEQAETAKAEIYRRMLQAEESEPDDASTVSGQTTSSRSRLALALYLVCVVPMGAFLMYAYLGSPELPGKPYAARQNDSEFIMEKGAEQLAAVLEKKPEAGGYKQVADAYFLLHRYDQAVEAYQKSVELNGGNAAVWSELGESLALAHGGHVVPEAQAAFAKALTLDPHDARARFYLGLAEMQLHEPRRAVAIWRDLENDSSPDAPWMALVKEQIAKVSKEGGFDPASVTPAPPSLQSLDQAAPPDVDPDAAAVVMAMPPAEQKAMIRHMVDRLAAKMKQNPGDRDGWQRLAKAYRALGETQKAQEAESKAAALR